MSEKVNVIVTIKCKENLKSKVIEAFDIAVEKTRKEKGCLTYRLLEYIYTIKETQILRMNLLYWKNGKTENHSWHILSNHILRN